MLACPLPTTIHEDNITAEYLLLIFFYIHALSQENCFGVLLTNRSSRPEVFCKKAFSKTFCRIHRKTSVLEFLF